MLAIDADLFSKAQAGDPAALQSLRDTLDGRAIYFDAAAPAPEPGDIVVPLQAVIELGVVKAVMLLTK